MPPVIKDVDPLGADALALLHEASIDPTSVCYERELAVRPPVPTPWLSMQVVHAAPEDARAVAEIHVGTWRAAYASIVPADYLASLSVEQREAMWSQCIATGVPELLVAKDAGVVQGWLSFGQSRDEGSPKTQAEVWALYVCPASWSTGAGRLLWLRARALMLEQGFTSCSLWVFPQNDRAIRFYRSAGFAHDEAPPKIFRLGSAQLQEVRFVSELDG